MRSNLSLKNKIFFIFVVVMVIAISFIGWYGFNSTKKSYIDAAYYISEQSTKSLDSQIEQYLKSVPKDILFTTNFYALKRYLIWKSMGESKKAKKWKNIFSDGLLDFLKTKKAYYKARVLDINGDELISAEYAKDINSVYLKPSDKLQNKKGRKYFKIASKLKKGEFYVSEFNLNIEHGKIERPFVPVIRYATPIIDENNQFNGVFVVNIYAEHILNMIKMKEQEYKDKHIKYFLVDANGNYIYHKDENKRWGTQLENNENFNKEHFNLKEFIKNEDSGVFTYNNKIYSFNLSHPLKGDYNNHWYLISAVDVHTALIELKNFKLIFLTLLLFGLTFSFILVRIFISKLIKPLTKATNQLKALATGEIKKENIVYEDKDEIGDIVISTAKVIDSIETTIEQANAVANGNFSKDIQLLSENDELGNAILTMTNMLSINHIETKNEIWLSEGLGKFSDSLAGINDILELSKKAITVSSHYVDAISSVFYILDKKEDELSFMTSFAFNNPTGDLSIKFKIGEGVIGQVALEKKFVLLKDVKDKNFEIQTGITTSKSKEVFIFPIIYDGELLGVVEMMSLYSFSELQKDYLLKVADLFALALHTTSQSIQIKTLLKESQNAFEELQIKSEEMQTQSEQLQASNKQMESQAYELELQAANLKSKNLEIEKGRKEIDKRAKELETSNKYKSEFLANMSHELRTPLNSIILLSSLLSKNSKDNLNESDIQKADVINESGKELLRLINDILDLSKIESGKMELIIDDIDTNELVKSYISSFIHTAKDKGLEFKIVDNIDGVFYNDKDRLGQIVKNLVSNAFKFTKEGSITLQFDKVDNEKLPIRISVIDTGMGISKDKQDDIFKAFTQADGSTSRKFGGTGLGLSISKELSHLMHGDIKLDSIEGKGSTFTILLPNLKDQFSGIINRKENPNLNQKQILIIEDDKNFANTLKYIVEDRGEKAFVAYTGAKGLEYIKNNKVDGVIIDIGLSDINGIDVIKEIKSNKLTKNIHIQVVSGKDKDSINFDDIKIDGYLQKPVSKEQISNAISNLEALEDKDPKSILIVEDDEVHLKALVEYIEDDSRYKIITASNVSEAKQVCENNYFDLAIVDLGLGDEDGKEICRYLSEHRNNTSILIYTGKDLTKDEVDLLNDISDEIIIKNLNSNERLKDEIDRFLTVPSTTVNKRFKIQNIQQVDSDKIDTTILDGKKVLIVDDDIKNIFVLSSVLQEHNMEIFNAKNGQEALNFLNDNFENIDIILMDIMMPIMDGYEAIKAIRSDDKLKHLPIIAVTAKAMEQDRKEALESGADDYITKPIDLQKLSSMIVKWIDK